VETRRRPRPESVAPSLELITFPVQALLILEERLRKQQAEGVRMPEGMELDELAFGF
jgi:hypothetical protein